MDKATAVLEDTLSCSICLEILEVPKSLLCGHNFCGRCLQGYLEGQTGVRAIKCPQCRDDTPVPDSSRPVSEWVNQLKTNCGIQNVIESLTEHVRSNCDICKSEGNEVRSHHFCKTCELRLCRPCHVVHQKIPACRDHNIQQLSVSPPPVFRKYDFKIHLDTSSSATQRYQQALLVKKEMKDKVEAIGSSAVQSVKDKETELMKEISGTVDDVFDRFNARFPVQAPEDESTDYPEQGEQLLTTIRLSSKIESFTASTHDVALGTVNVGREFQDDKVSDLSLASDEGMEIEKINIRGGEEDSSSDSSSDSSGADEDVDEDFVPVFDSKIESMTEGDDNDPWIRSILVITSCDIETILVTDNNNMCVKSFYKDKDVFTSEPYSTSRLVLGGEPWGLTELENERIAVSCPKKKTIYTIRVNPALKKVKEIGVGKKFFALATLDATTLVGSAPEERPPSIDFFDLNGRILKTITKNRLGKNLFESPYYITMSAWGDILVAEEKSRTVQFLTKEGYIKARLTSEERSRPASLYGIACDSLGNVFLADREGGRVVRMREGKKDEVFLTKDEGVSFPRCVAVYRREAVYVAEEGGAINKFLLDRA